MTIYALVYLASGLLSLAFSYIPKLSTWYAEQSAQIKKLVMGAALLVTTGAVFGFGCAGWAASLGLPQLECTQYGAGDALKMLMLALAVNQGVYKITKPAQYDPVHARPLPFVDDGKDGDGFTPQ